MDSLNLKTLLEVVSTGSFSKAAGNLFVTQSAVSRRVKFLEEECGCELLDRCGAVVRPTEAGRQVVSQARKILTMEEALLRQLEGVKQVPHISFGCTRPFGIIRMPGILKEYMEKYSNLKDLTVSFEMPHRLLQRLQENRLDLIVIEHWEALELSNYRTLSLPEDEMVFVSAPSLRLSKPMVSIDELVGQRLYRRKEECCSWKYLTLNMRVVGRSIAEFTKTMIYDDLHVILEAVKAGDGIALMSSDLVRKHVAEGTLCEHRVEGFNHRRKRTLILGDCVTRNTALLDMIAAIYGSFRLPPPDLDQLFLPVAR